MSATRPAPGTPLVFQWRKWDGSLHWRHDYVYLGSDRWGEWIGQPIGRRNEHPGSADGTDAPHSSRPPTTHVSQRNKVTVLSPDGLYAATTFRDHPRGTEVYIDIACDVRFDSETRAITGIDMDLDVVRRAGPEGTWIDDRDEWEEHSTRYGYPVETMARLEALALDLEQRVRAHAAPFNATTSDPWLDRLEALGLTAPAA